MHTNNQVASRHVLAALIAAAGLFGTAARCAADGSDHHPSEATAPLSVSVVSGRTFIGEVDPQTDGDVLWLRMGGGNIVLRRPIEWGRVTHVRQENVELSFDDVRKLARSSGDRPRPLLPPPPIPAEDWTMAKAWSAVPAPPAPVSRIVTALQIDAELGHWTAGVEASGIVICVYPINADGAPTPIDGTLEVNLLAQRPARDGEGDGLPSIGRWTQTVRTSDFGPSGAVYRLPFQAVHPDFDLKLRPHALVHARLSVPGQGTFEASAAMVRIREYSSVRDRLQEHTGSRFAPIEQTDRQ